MSYLLDTHTFLWSVMDEDQLSSPVKSILQEATDTAFVSVITFWEISLKYSLNKLKLTGVGPFELKQTAEKNHFKIMPLGPDEAATFHQLPWLGSHRDPFDRMLIWQALQNNLTIISKDANFKLYLPLGLKTIW